jgi:hypothetical protein
MLRDIHRTRLCNRVPAASLLALTLFAAGCTGGGFGGPAAPPAASASASPPAAGSAAATPPPAPNLTDKIESFFTKSATTEPHPTTANQQQQSDIDCPLIDIREGASTLTIPPPPPDGSNEAMSLKYQGIFVRAARDCKAAGNQLVMRVGVEGRIIVGPAGGPGEVDVPLRIAIVDSPAGNPQTVLTKLIRIPVMLGPSDGSMNFTHVEDGLAFPMPTSAEIDNYIVYIGFDQIGAEEEDKAKLKPVPKHKAKPKPKPNPNAPTG